MGEIGLLSWSPSHAIETLLAADDLPMARIDTTSVGIPADRCPFSRLPFIERGDVALVTSYWLYNNVALGHSAVDMLKALGKRFRILIGFDHNDAIELSFDNEHLEYFDRVLKWNGCHLDRDLYNYRVGCSRSDGCWAEKKEPRSSAFRSELLAKVCPSVPCFLNLAAGVRRGARRVYGMATPKRWLRNLADGLLGFFGPPAMSTTRPPRYTVHFYASLTHGQRAVAARMIQRSGLAWKGGITQVWERITGYREDRLRSFNPFENDQFRDELSREGLLVQPLSRLKYRMSIHECKSVLSIAGHGELCFRMAEAWANRRVLVCQDLSHLKTLFPFRPGENVVYCKPDLSNLIEILGDIETNYRRYLPIAEKGYRDWVAWSSNWRQVVRTGFSPLYASRTSWGSAADRGTGACLPSEA